MHNEPDGLVHRVIGGDEQAVAEVARRASTATAPVLLVVAALLAADHGAILQRAADHASTTCERQLVALAAAHLAADHELFDALVRDHLADHPDSVVAAWIAATHRSRPTP